MHYYYYYYYYSYILLLLLFSEWEGRGVHNNAGSWSHLMRPGRWGGLIGVTLSPISLRGEVGDRRPRRGPHSLQGGGPLLDNIIGGPPSAGGVGSGGGRRPVRGPHSLPGVDRCSMILSAVLLLLGVWARGGLGMNKRASPRGGARQDANSRRVPHTVPGPHRGRACIFHFLL